MSWFWIVILGHLLTAVGFVLGKALLSKTFTDAYVFTFFIGVLGLGSLLLIPFGFDIPDARTIIFNFVAGGLLAIAFLYFNLALQGTEASRIVPFVGALIPLFSLVFELLFMDGSFSTVQLIAFAVLVVGSVIITIEYKSAPGEKRAKTPRLIWIYGFLAAVLFAVSFGMTAIAFTHQQFLSAFIWMRIGTFLGVVGFLSDAARRQAIKESISVFAGKGGVLYLTTQAVSGLGFVLITYALSLASVAIVNAMQGVQYVFLLGLAMVGSLKYPELLKENLGRSSLGVKVTGMVVISLGIVLLAQGI